MLKKWSVRMTQQEYNKYIMFFKDFTTKEMEQFAKMIDTVYFHYLRCLSAVRETPEAMDDVHMKRLIHEAGVDELKDVMPVVEKFRNIK